MNADMGEAVGIHSFGNDAQLLNHVDAINVACGYHAGGPATMATTVAAAASTDPARTPIKIGAHPGLPDIQGFGRRAMALSPKEVTQIVRYQVGALTAFLGDTPLNHIKPHGALWGMAAKDEAIMRAIAEVCQQYNVAFFGCAGTAHESVCQELGIEFIKELYVDLDYDKHGHLIIQRHAQLTDPEKAAARVRNALAGKPIQTADGAEITIAFDSVCIHSDAPNCAEVAAAVKAEIAAHAANTNN